MQPSQEAPVIDANCQFGEEKGASYATITVCETRILLKPGSVVKDKKIMIYSEKSLPGRSSLVDINATYSVDLILLLAGRCGCAGSLTRRRQLAPPFEWLVP